MTKLRLEGLCEGKGFPQIPAVEGNSISTMHHHPTLSPFRIESKMTFMFCPNFVMHVVAFRLSLPIFVSIKKKLQKYVD